MATVGVSITKSTSFRGATQEFSNVYYFDIAAGSANQADASDLIDKVTAIDKQVHSSLVSYKQGRCWTSGGTAATNNMLDQHNLSGTGLGVADANQDKERAFLVRLRAGSDSRGNPVYLRKWFHVCGAIQGGTTPTSGNLAQTSPLTQAQKDQVTAVANLFKSVGFTGGVAILKAKSGRGFDAAANFQCHNWFEHHQLGDQWRAQ